MDISQKIKLIRNILQKTSDNNLDDVLKKIDKFTLNHIIYVIRKNIDDKIIEYIIVDEKKMFFRYVYGSEFYYHLNPIEDWDLADGKSYNIDRDDTIYILY
jgi:hypothetical protein